MKNEKGITIIALVLTVILMLIISSVIIYNVRKSTNVQGYNNMCADIQLLEDKIAVYYNKYGDIPKSNQNFNTPSSITTSEDGGTYYEIDKTALQNLTLKLSKGIEDLDKYIINDKSHKVYYLKGIDFDGDIYYSKTVYLH